MLLSNTHINVAIIIIIIISVVVFVNLSYTKYKDVTVKFLNTSEIQDYLRGVSTQQYFSTISPQILIQKTNGGTSSGDYERHLHPLLPKERKWIRECLSTIPPNPMINSNLTWTFIGTSNKLESGMPYTVGQVIFLPPSLTSKNLSIQRTVTHTLCHEWIHILQRRFPELHYKFITKSMRFRSAQIVGPWKLGKYEIYSNPDGLQRRQGSWVFSDNKRKWYLPLLLTVPTTGKLTKLSLQVDLIQGEPARVKSRGILVDNITSILGKRFPMCPSSNLYHPHEILAELGANYLMEGTTHSSVFDKFFQILGNYCLQN